MTEPERVDGRVRDLAELCTRHGTPCADGLLAEIGRLRTALNDRNKPPSDEKLTKLHDKAHQHKSSRPWRIVDWLVHQLDARQLELTRTTCDWEVAIREAAAAREALRFAREFIDAAPFQVPGIDTAVVLSMIDGALDQRLAQ